MKQKRRGQSIMEYVVVFTAIVAAILAAVTLLGGTGGTTGLGRLMQRSSEKIVNATTTDLGGLVP